MNHVKIDILSARIGLVPVLASWHFKQWGQLTGASTGSGYKELLYRNSYSRSLPLTLIALSGEIPLGSVNIVDCDMDIRSEFRPWLGQLYVDQAQRGRGIGSLLVDAAVNHCRKLSFTRLYLYTSGTLPSFYERLGWELRKTVHYKERDRTVMEIRLTEVRHK